VSMLEVRVHLEECGVREDNELVRREVRDLIVEVRELQASERARLAQRSHGRLERVGVELVRVRLSGAQVCSEHAERGVDDGVLRALVRKVEPRVQEREYDLFCSGI
jgi:carbamoylphosphate synthase large subunit